MRSQYDKSIPCNASRISRYWILQDGGLIMTSCFCTKTYQCLSCESKSNRKETAPSNRKVAQCGTRAGYNRHLKQGEPTCDDCKAAQSAAVSKWKQKVA